MPGLGCGRTPWGCLVLGVVGSPVGAPVLASWPYCLGGVSRHPPGTVVDPSRPRLWQWVAVSAASETACRRAAVHLPACSATGGPAPHRAAPRSQHPHQRSRSTSLTCVGRWPRALIPVAVEGGSPPLGGRAVYWAAARLREERRRGWRWAGSCPATRRAPPPPLPILPLSSLSVADGNAKYKIVSGETGKTGEPPSRCGSPSPPPRPAAPPGAPPPGTGCGACGPGHPPVPPLSPHAARHPAGAQAAQRSADQRAPGPADRNGTRMPGT